MNYQAQIAAAEAELDSGEIARAHQLLEPLVKAGDAQAIYLAGCMGKRGETDSEFQLRYVHSVEVSAKKGFPQAVYALGVFYDVGEHGYEIDKVRASHLFKKAADLGHLRSKWIHACELLWGLGSYEQNIRLGLDYLEQSAAGNFEEALETKARLYERGEFGYEKSVARAAELRAMISEGNAGR